MNGDEFIFTRDGADRGTNAVGAGLSPGTEGDAIDPRIADDLHERVIVGRDDDEADIRTRRECSDCVKDDGFAGEGLEELVAPEASRATGGGEDDGEWGHLCSRRACSPW